MKNKKRWMIIAASIVGVTIIGGGSYLLINNKPTLSAQEAADAAATQANDAVQSKQMTAKPLDPTTTTGTASANSSAAPAQSGSTLRASSNAASGLGQLNTSNQSGTASAGQSANNSASSSSSNPFDPSTFFQYDKYKGDSSALSGDAQVGTGATLESGKKAVVYYRGWLTNGTLFDESRADTNGKMQPFSFTVGAHQVITGWEQGLVGMKVGGVRLLIVPPAVGYGDTSQGSIPANSLLIFQVQLADVQ